MARRARCSKRLVGAAALLLGRAAMAQDVLTIWNPALLPAGGSALQFSASAFAADDMVPVRDIGDARWPADARVTSATERMVGSLRVDAGASDADGWNAGLFYRQDWSGHATPDTVSAYVRNQYDQLGTQTRGYALDYSLTGFAADGVRVGHSWNWEAAGASQFAFGVSAELMRGVSLRSDSMQGTLQTALGAGSLSGSRTDFDTGLAAVQTGASFNDFVPSAAQAVADGTGWGLDLGATWIAAGGFRIAFAANDLGARLHWNNVPMIATVATHLSYPYLTPQRTPAVQGLDAYAPVTLRLQAKYMLEADLPPQAGIVGSARLEAQGGVVYPQLGLDWEFAPRWNCGIDYDTRFGALGVDLRHGGFSFGLSTQSANLAQSRAVGAELGYTLRF
jgi:hypothetical protein